eukprot:TRINITY_DN1316_c0_g1_i4.p1 TRINITY_DN1316_c0_g1~~TRINITY_DN1316_c0_g1_i4.p1  ORF type:complete len:114 (+),score=27.35 TRINITY_DN1316_c0_g1_i4:203-544(+)
MDLIKMSSDLLIIAQKVEQLSQQTVSLLDKCGSTWNLKRRSEPLEMTQFVALHEIISDFIHKYSNLMEALEMMEDGIVGHVDVDHHINCQSSEMIMIVRVIVTTSDWCYDLTK